MSCHVTSDDAALTLEEWIEGRALESLSRAAADPSCERVGGALASHSASDPSILLNRVQGLGVQAAAAPDEIRAVMRAYAERGVSDYFVQLHRGRTRASDEELTALGLERARGWRKFSHGLSTEPGSTSALAVRQLAAEAVAQIRAFGDVVCGAFDLRPATTRLFPGLARDSRWHLFMSFQGDAPAGTGALFVDRHPASGQRLGFFDFGATHPEFRRRGSQSAIIRARIALGRRLGCRRLITATGEAVPGDPQHSYQNLLRAGFREGLLRENWRPIRPARA